jgi:hypothetical protein
MNAISIKVKMLCVSHNPKSRPENARIAAEVGPIALLPEIQAARKHNQGWSDGLDGKIPGS